MQKGVSLYVDVRPAAVIVIDVVVCIRLIVWRHIGAVAALLALHIMRALRGRGGSDQSAADRKHPRLHI